MNKSGGHEHVFHCSLHECLYCQSYLAPSATVENVAQRLPLIADCTLSSLPEKYREHASASTAAAAVATQLAQLSYALPAVRRIAKEIASRSVQRKTAEAAELTQRNWRQQKIHRGRREEAESCNVALGPRPTKRLQILCKGFQTNATFSTEMANKEHTFC